MIALAAALLATAAAPWSPPAPVGGSAAAFPLLEPGLLTFGIASPGGRRTTAFGAPVEADGTVGDAERIKRRLSVDALASYGRGRVLGAGTGVGAGDRRTIGIAFGRAGGPLGRVRTVVRRAGFPLALDANRAGAAALVTARCRRARCTPVLVVRRPGRRFGRPIVLGRAGRVTAAATAVNDPVVSGLAPLYAAVQPAAGGFGSPEAVSAPDAYVDPEAVGLVFLPGGRAVAAWRQVGERIHTSWR